MDEDDERSAGAIGLGRTLALSDGIFAIAMTLLAFQIQVPNLTGNEVHHLSRALGDLGDRYYVFALTFSVIGLFWLAHHRLFNQVERADEPLMLLNLLLLMTIAFLPFSSSVLGRYGGERVAVIFYASSLAVTGTLLTALIAVARHRRLLVATRATGGGPQDAMAGRINCRHLCAVDTDRDRQPVGCALYLDRDSPAPVRHSPCEQTGVECRATPNRCSTRSLTASARCGKAPSGRRVLDARCWM